MRQWISVNSRTLLLTVSILSSGAIQALGYYHPDEGRWISRDPIGEVSDMNLYGASGFVGGFYTGPDLISR
jgi:hypothetical protein